eukprot:m.785739 g.785739  ORF g.785739 m.785739 type:complete len:104 (-) comp59168_c0_seq27:9-320(-)
MSLFVRNAVVLLSSSRSISLFSLCFFFDFTFSGTSPGSEHHLTSRRMRRKPQSARLPTSWAFRHHRLLPPHLQEPQLWQLRPLLFDSLDQIEMRNEARMTPVS